MAFESSGSINTVVASSGAGVEASNIGFAIDIDTAMAVVEALLGQASTSA